MSFSQTKIEALNGPLSREVVKTRKQSGREFSYVEGWHVIAEANRIFGFDGWTRETIDINCVSEKEREIGENKLPGWGVSYIGKVRVVADGVTREGCGAGHGIDRDLGLAHESAIKEAETDAMKRAFMTFGNPFGLALYDKEQVNVIDAADASRQRFIDQCKADILRLAERPGDLLAWWRSSPQMKARRDFDLDTNQVNDLKNMVIARLPPAITKEANRE